MSYKSGCCCSSGRGRGLGDVIYPPGSDPIALTRAITRLHLGFQSTLQKLPSGNAYLAENARLVQGHFNAATAAMARRDYASARSKVNALEQFVPDFARRVAEATMGGGQALEEAKAGASIWNQVLSAVGISPSVPIYRPDSKTADAFQAGGWLLALGAGALALTLVVSLVKR